MKLPKLTLGPTHSCYLGQHGKAACWGDNLDGELGDGTNARRSLPTEVADAGRLLDISAGAAGTCAVRSDTRVVCWGPIAASSKRPAEVPGLEGVRAVAVGLSHACATLAGGRVACWGDNRNGQLGHGSTAGASGPVLAEAIHDAIAIAVDEQASCAVHKDGGLSCWGVQGREPAVRTPKRVEGVTGARAVRLSGRHACAILDGGTVTCWGEWDDESSRPGNGHASASPHWSNVVDLAIGGQHSCALLADGTVSCRGSGSSFGGASNNQGRWDARPVPELTTAMAEPVTQIVAAGGVTCVAGKASAACAGDNSHGQLGIGESVRFDRPLPIAGVADIVQVLPGRRSACALRKDGRVLCWGAGSAEVDGERSAADGPARARVIDGLSGVDRLFPGTSEHQICARDGGRRLRCFEPARAVGPVKATLDEDGRRLVPREALGLEGVTWNTPIDFTGAAYAVLGSGEVVAWQERKSKPGAMMSPSFQIERVTLKSLSNVVQISTHHGSACVVWRTGKVGCFSALSPFNSADPQAKRPTPYTLSGIDGAVELAETATGWCARSKGGKVRCWDTTYGEKRSWADVVPMEASSLANVPALSHWLSAAHVGAPYSRSPDGALAASNGKLLTRNGQQLDFGRPVAAVESRWNTCVIFEGGEVGCWGSNMGGALGSTDRWQSHKPLMVKLPGGL